MRDIYLIDFENVASDGLNGISSLTPEDQVVIFYSNNSNRLTMKMHILIGKSQCDFNYFEVTVGGKNALDHQISTWLGYLIGTKAAQRSYYIVSRDMGYKFVANFWMDSEADVNIRCVDSIRSAVRLQSKLDQSARQEKEDPIALLPPPEPAPMVVPAPTPEAEAKPAPEPIGESIVESAAPAGADTAAEAAAAAETPAPEPAYVPAPASGVTLLFDNTPKQTSAGTTLLFDNTRSSRREEPKKPEAPKPEMKPEAPKPEKKTESPRQEKKQDAPKQEQKSNAPKQAQKADGSKQEQKSQSRRRTKASSEKTEKPEAPKQELSGKNDELTRLLVPYPVLQEQHLRQLIAENQKQKLCNHLRKVLGQEKGLALYNDIKKKAWH